MTRRQWRAVAILTALIVAGLVLIATSDLAGEVVNPKGDVTPRRKETRPMFANCAHASIAGVPLPMQVGDPGWNPRLDRDKNGLAC